MTKIERIEKKIKALENQYSEICKDDSLSDREVTELLRPINDEISNLIIAMDKRYS